MSALLSTSGSRAAELAAAAETTGVAKTNHAVVIAGGGPTGLMLAGELALAGVDVAIVERRASQDLAGSRAGGLHARAIEVLDQRGIADRFLSQGQAHQVVHFHIPLDISDFPTRHNYVLGLWQNHIERILAEWVGELAVTIYRGREVTGFAQDDTGVDVALSDGQSLRAAYLVGCDGGRSLIRKAAGIEFPGWDPTTSWLIAEVETAEEPKWGLHQDARGIHGIGKVENGGSARIVLTEPHAAARQRTHAARCQRGARRRLRDRLRDPQSHLDLPLHRHDAAGRCLPRQTRAAGRRRRTRASAGGRTGPQHRCAGCGESGMEAGPGGQADIAGKPAGYLPCRAPSVAARVLHNTMAQVALRRTDDRTKALGDTMSELLGMDEPRRRFAADMSGLDIHYDLGEGHKLLGRRMPDLDLLTADGPLRVFTLLHDARPVLLNFGEPGGFDITPWADRVKLVDARYDGVWELPVLGAVPAPAAVLIRPDGYVAWVGDADPAGAR